MCVATEKAKHSHGCLCFLPVGGDGSAGIGSVGAAVVDVLRHVVPERAVHHQERRGRGGDAGGAYGGVAAPDALPRLLCACKSQMQSDTRSSLPILLFSNISDKSIEILLSKLTKVYLYIYRSSTLAAVNIYTHRYKQLTRNLYVNLTAGLRCIRSAQRHVRGAELASEQGIAEALRCRRQHQGAGGGGVPGGRLLRRHPRRRRPRLRRRGEIDPYA